MTVVGDPEVDPEFGTGIMKVTPAHDPHDFELGQKYHLPVTPIIDFNGRMDFSWYLNDPTHTNPDYRARAEKYHGKKIAEARKLMVEDLQADGLLVKTDAHYTHNVGVCYRCGTTIEPLPLPQFFVKVAPLVKPVLAALKKGDVTIHGAGHDKILHHWLKQLKDWNISRQIVWGIQIPVWYEVDSNPELHITFLDATKTLKTGTLATLLKTHTLSEIKAGLQQLRAPVGAAFVVSPTPPADNYLQETDTFDTWFSSGQWPFTTLQSTKPGDFERFYPTAVMETGYDILPFWVMRMLLLGVFATGQVPFHDVYLHGLVRDQKGQKMSKSKGNVINPLEVIEKYGADAVRLALVIRSSPGLDKSVGEPDFKAMRNFTNKLWNAARFVLSNLTETTNSTSPNDTLFLDSLTELSQQVSQQLTDFKLGLAAETLFNEFWHQYCDLDIERAKKGELSYSALLAGLVIYLKLLHPFVPFVTEAIWQELHQAGLIPDQPKLLVASPWPYQAQ
jgi:valyl-tRNA synthetase